jgi:hypothetical protein
MELDELAQRLAMLEDGAAAQRAAAEQSQFMDKYGTKFSGDEGIGVAILAELGRRGIDTSAADEAVQDILDRIRAEATAVLDKIKMDERTVSDLMDKVATVEEAVQAAGGAVPGADANVGTIPPEINLEGGIPPEAAAEMPPPEEAPPIEEPAAMPPGIPSDQRLKTFRQAGKQRKQRVYRPHSGIISAIRSKM